MDRQALVQRNRAMANAFHQPSFRHHLRRLMLKMIAFAPIPKQRKLDRERILLIRPDHLGDVLLTTPAIHFLRQAAPHAEIHVLVGEWTSALFENNTDVDLALTLSFPGFDRVSSRTIISPYQLAFETALRLRKVGYSKAVILRPDHWWGALVAFFAGIPRRYGYDMPGNERFLTDKLRLENEHAVLQNARLIGLLVGQDHPSPDELRLQITVQDNDRDWVRERLSASHIPPDKPIIVIHPGSGASIKLWNEVEWVYIANTLAAQLEAAVVLTGSSSELPLVRRIANQIQYPVVALAGETSLGMLAALFERAQLVLGPDSGPLHLASATGTPSVVLFGPADPVQFKPWGDPEKHIAIVSDIGCRPCRVLDWGSDPIQFHPCVREIPPRVVLDAARRVLQLKQV